MSVNQWLINPFLFLFALIRVYSRLKKQIGLNAEDAERAEGVPTEHSEDAKGLSLNVGAQICCARPTPFPLCRYLDNLSAFAPLATLV